MHETLHPKGHYCVEHFRAGEVIATYKAYNLVTTEAKALMLNAMFNGSASTSSWYLGLINATPTPTLLSADTAGSHVGWVEITAVTNESSLSLRPIWTTATVSGNSITNVAPSIFNFTAGGTVYGLCVMNDSTLGGSSGVLFSAAPFSASVVVLGGDQMRVTYTLQI